MNRLQLLGLTVVLVVCLGTVVRTWTLGGGLPWFECCCRSCPSCFYCRARNGDCNCEECACEKVPPHISESTRSANDWWKRSFSSGIRTWRGRRSVSKQLGENDNSLNQLSEGERLVHLAREQFSDQDE